MLAFTIGCLHHTVEKACNLLQWRLQLWRVEQEGEGLETKLQDIFYISLFKNHLYIVQLHVYIQITKHLFYTLTNI